MTALAPLPAHEPEDTPVDQEALIREARRRARRRRMAFAAAVLAALGTALGIFFWTGGPRAPHSGRPRTGGVLPQAGSVVGTLPLSPQETVQFATRQGTLFVLVIEPGQAHSISIFRLDHEGTTNTRKRVQFPLPAYLSDISAGPDGIYAGTAVVRRFTNARDELIRIDPRTLTVRARAFFPSSVATVAHGRWVWAALGDGRVLRLDPRTLSVDASQRILSPAAAANFVALLSRPAFGLGSLWVLAGSCSAPRARPDGSDHSRRPFANARPDRRRSRAATARDRR